MKRLERDKTARSEGVSPPRARGFESAMKDLVEDLRQKYTELSAKYAIRRSACARRTSSASASSASAGGA
jgi:hypothetical protein